MESDEVRMVSHEDTLKVHLAGRHRSKKPLPNENRNPRWSVHKLTTWDSFFLLETFIADQPALKSPSNIS